MYESFFGLREKPFSLLPDPSFLYLSKIHQEALTLLEYGLRSQSGFTILTGEIGSGKTTLMRYLLDRLDDDITVGLISHTHHSLGQIMDWVCLAFDLSVPSGVKIDQHQAFVAFLIDQYAKGKRTLLIVDEAQNLGLDKLEELRLLSNINADKDLVLQLLLLGQPQLRELLREPELEQFVQRVSASYHLGRLTSEETYRYIRHRLQVAGGHKEIFSADACHAVFHYSKGIPRIINLLCETALVCAYGAGEKRVLGATIDQLVKTQASHLLVTLDQGERSRLPEPAPVAMESAAPADAAPHTEPFPQATRSAARQPSAAAAGPRRPRAPIHLVRDDAAEAAAALEDDQDSRDLADDAIPNRHRERLDTTRPPTRVPARRPAAARSGQRPLLVDLAAMAVSLLVGFGLVYWLGADRGATAPAPTTAVSPADQGAGQPADTGAAGSEPPAQTPASADTTSAGAEPVTAPAATDPRPAQAADAPEVTLPTVGEPPRLDTAADTTAPAPVGTPDEDAANGGAAPAAATTDQGVATAPAATPTAAGEPAREQPAAATTVVAPGRAALSALDTRLQGLAVATTRIDDDHLQADLAQSVTFSANSTQLDAASKSFLARLANAVGDAAGVRLEVVAHTDSSGSDAFNLALSERRAAAVASYLVARGIAPARVAHAGKGKSELKTDPAREKRVGAWVNRRVEIDFTADAPAGDQVAR